MILMYHKIGLESPTLWWVEVDQFYRQLCELQAYDVVYLDDYDPQNPRHAVITFDGIYQNVLTYAAPLLKKFNYPFELFFSGDYLGKGNEFDTVEPYAKFTTIEELQELVKLGGRLQWHTHSHPKLSESSNEDFIRKELTVPDKFKKLDKKGFRWFAYPYGEFNDLTLEITQSLFKGGISCVQGNDVDKYKLNRITATNELSITEATIGVIIPSFNYGSFLVEAIESVLRQTRPVHQILIVDDGSGDNTSEIGEVYARKYPDKIRFIRNGKNLGIVKNFNKAVKQMPTDYICFLGADNRFRSDYIEKTSAILDKNSDIAIAYTDFALFGPRASSMYDLMPKDRRAGVKAGTYYLVQFPEFETRTLAQQKEANFMHGSSLFRRKVFLEVDGYQEKKSRAEDHDLFYRMIKAGWKAKRVPEPVLEYRQHSKDQANTKLNSFAELHFYRTQNRKLEAELNQIKSSKYWKLLYLYKDPKHAFKNYGPKIASKIKRKLHYFFTH